MRALAAAYAALLVAMVCHVAGGGSVASPVALALVAAATTPVAIWVSRRPWSARELMALFLFAQAAVHLTCAGSSPHGAESAAPATMLGWHLIATTVCVAAALWGQRCIHAAYDSLGVRVTRIRVIALGVVTSPPAAVPEHDDRPPRQWLGSIAPVRGPPARVRT